MNEESIVELWVRMKPFINAKERMDAADAFVSVLDENGMADVLESQGEMIPDKHLRAATISYFGIDDEGDDEEDY